MKESDHKIFHSIQSMAIVICTMAVLLFISSCSGNRKRMGEAITERDSLPVMDTHDVTTLISDSGVTRYRITTPRWLVFDRKEPPHWAFEQGIHLEKFDTLFTVEASIDADTAYYYNKEELWKLMGHVAIQNLKGERFNTELLYWDQRKKKIYSDRFIRIEQVDKVLTGYGFESNQQMTEYQIFNNTGIFTVEDTAPVDSTQQH